MERFDHGREGNAVESRRRGEDVGSIGFGGRGKVGEIALVHESGFFWFFVLC
jgi:hypothetical protein